MPRGRVAAVLLLVLVAVGGLGLLFDGGEETSGGSAGSGNAAAGLERPNIVVVMTDDQGLETVEDGTPESVRTVAAEGTSFSEAIVTTPLCCPSRIGFMTGQYGHNNGVLRNDPGYETLKDPPNVLPTWLRGAGYRTSFVGKFVNGYDRTRRGERLRPAPGWAEWAEMERPYSYYGYAINDGGSLTGYGEKRKDYLTSVLTRRALQSVGRLRTDSRPLMLWLATWAPHSQSPDSSSGPCRGNAIPADREPSTEARAGYPGPDALERDVSDKPFQIERIDPIGARGLRDARLQYRCAIGSLSEVDRGLRRLRERLRELGELDRTVFVYTSDNGYLFGQHRLLAGKSVPYEPAIRVPFVVDLPPAYGEQPETLDAPVANIDLAPTLLDLAGAEPCSGEPRSCRRLDGRSLLPLLEGEDPTGWMERSLLIESGKGQPCPFAAVRTEGRKYVKYPSRPLRACREPERELYDLESDPGELENELGTATPSELSGSATELDELVDRLRDCAGTGEGEGEGACP